LRARKKAKTKPSELEVQRERDRLIRSVPALRARMLDGFARNLDTRPAIFHGRSYGRSLPALQLAGIASCQAAGSQDGRWP
jgi:hypothetical protein